MKSSAVSETVEDKKYGIIPASFYLTLYDISNIFSISILNQLQFLVIRLELNNEFHYTDFNQV